MNLNSHLIRNPVIAALTALFLLLLPLSSENSLSQEKKGSPPRVEIAGTEVHTIISSIVAGQEYTLHVHLPRFYSDSSRTFPAVYVLDGQWDFPLVNALHGQLYYDGFVPGLIIIGITWGGKNPKVDSLRARDYTPSHNDQIPQSGGAAKFYSFVKQELIPFIEKKFRVSKTDRVLMGSSFGGLFTLYAMVQENQLFNRYIAASPATLWNRAAFYKDEKAYSDKFSRLPARLYVVAGEYEYVPGLNELVDRLKSRKYEGFHMESKVLENTGHSGSKTEGFSRGLQYVFERPSLTIDPVILNQYAGRYQVNPQMTVRLYVDKGRLMGEAGGGTQVLHAESESDFYVKGQYLFVHFMKDNGGKVSGFRVETFGGTEFAKKIE